MNLIKKIQNSIKEKFSKLTKRRLKIKTYLLNKHIDKQIDKQKEDNKTIDFSKIIIALTTIIPLSSFLYWCLFLDNFNMDYFFFCYAFDDVAYILYNKGVFLWYGILILSLFSISFYALLRMTKHRLMIIATIMPLIAIYALLKIGGFSLHQITFFLVLLIFVTIILYMYSKLAVYGYIVLLGLYLTTSAKNDSESAKKNQIRIDVISKAGDTLVNKNDTNRYYIHSTSKFRLIYNKIKNEPEKYNREDIK